MVNILFDCPNIDDFYYDLNKYFSSTMRVAVVAFSFYDDYVYDKESWNLVYGKNIGNGYFEVTDAFAKFGIKEENITFINYFTHTSNQAKQIIKNADVVYFTGGLPDRMMDRIYDFDLYDTLSEFDGIVVGYSAGAVIQLSEYHLTPDADYSEFGYFRGLPYLDSFYLEVHYEHKDIQNQSIKKVLLEKNKPIYVTHTRKGGIVVDNEGVKILGKVDVYT